MVDGLLQLEFKFKGVCSFDLPNPDLGEGNGTGVEAVRVSACCVDVLGIARKSSLSLTGRVASVSAVGVAVIALFSPNEQLPVSTSYFT